MIKGGETLAARSRHAARAALARCVRESLAGPPGWKDYNNRTAVRVSLKASASDVGTLIICVGILLVLSKFGPLSRRSSHQRAVANFLLPAGRPLRERWGRSVSGVPCETQKVVGRRGCALSSRLLAAAAPQPCIGAVQPRARGCPRAQRAQSARACPSLPAPRSPPLRRPARPTAAPQLASTTGHTCTMAPRSSPR